MRFTAYDGSTPGPPDAASGMHLRTERGLAYLMTAPGDLGMARAYVTGDLDLFGVTPATPTTRCAAQGPHELPGAGAVEALRDRAQPGPATAAAGPAAAGAPATLAPAVEGLRHSMTRDAEAISHHYDVSNRFYEMVLGPSMAYTCAVYPTPDASLEEAQHAKFDLVAASSA